MAAPKIAFSENAARCGACYRCDNCGTTTGCG